MNINVLFPSPFSSLCLSWPLNAVSPACAHCSLDSLAGSNTGDTALVSFVLCYSLPPCSCLCPFSCSPDHCWQQTSLPAVRAVFCFFLCCWRLLSELKLHYIFRKPPWRVILEPSVLGWCRLSQGSGFSTVADHLEPQAADRSLLADKSAAQHH